MGQSILHRALSAQSTDAKPTSYLTILALEDGLTAKLSDSTIYYRINTGTWKKLTKNSYTPAINTGETLQFKAEGLSPVHGSGIGTFTITAKCKLLGTPMSLYMGESDLREFAFHSLFEGCTNIISVSKDFLPATKLSGLCYTDMFYGCSSLVNAPELPATELKDACYYRLFAKCTSLVEPPSVLPALLVISQAYMFMFAECTSLQKAPTILALETTGYGPCKAMFQKCRVLSYVDARLVTINQHEGEWGTDNWLAYVAANGTFVKNPEATWTIKGFDGVPDGWTIVNEPIEEVAV